MRPIKTADSSGAHSCWRLEYELRMIRYSHLRFSQRLIHFSFSVLTQEWNVIQKPFRNLFQVTHRFCSYLPIYVSRNQYQSSYTEHKKTLIFLLWFSIILKRRSRKSVKGCMYWPISNKLYPVAIKIKWQTSRHDFTPSVVHRTDCF